MTIGVYTAQCPCWYDTGDPPGQWPLGVYPQQPITIPSPTPHKCPVCEGRCTVPYEFYQDHMGCCGTTSVPMSRVPCRACDGKGIIWAKP